MSLVQEKTGVFFHVASWLALGPFFVAAILVVLMLFHPLLGIIGPASNTFFVVALVAIFLGLIVGTISLFMAHSTKVWVRVLLGILYVPTVAFSLLLSGF